MTPSVTQTAALQALGGFLTAVLPTGTDIIRGQANRVPEPSSVDYVIMTPTARQRLETDLVSWTNEATTLDNQLSTRLTVQVDFHGDDAAADNAQTAFQLLRSPYACDYFAGLNLGVTPLDASDPNQIPFVNAESQYEDRWVVNAYLQINPVLSTTAQFADTLTADLISVDATFPPAGA
jgi:hypothetical protein